MDILAMIFPKEKQFYRMVERQVVLVDWAIKDFHKLINSYEKLSLTQRKQLISSISAKEQKDDDLYTDMVKALKITFITPIDREDLHQLVSTFEMILDTLEMIVFKIGIFKLKKIDKRLKDQADIIKKSFHKISQLIFALRNESEVEKLCKEIRQLEKNADKSYIKSLEELFSDSQTPLMIIKMKDLYSSVEKISDKIHEASLIIENIAVKYS